MKYIELTVHTTAEASELVADVMWNYTTFGVAVCDVNDIISLQKDSSVFWDYLDDSLKADTNSEVLVKCFLSMETADTIAFEIMSDIRLTQERSGGAIAFGTLEDTKRIVDGDDWIEIWKKHFHPIHLGRIVVVPEWIDYQRQAGEEIVLLDSNMAFGTGEHETTAMCVERMQGYLKSGDEVVDVGCGSGILGISAAKLGAKKCILTDLDGVAVDSAKHNVLKNGVSEQVSVYKANLLDGFEVQGDIVLANITAEVLLLLAPALPKTLKAGGTLILSGIIKDRLDLVKEKYSSYGFQIIREENRGEWYALVLKRGE